LTYRTRIFLDFWNFQLAWNFKTLDAATGEPLRCDWTAIPRVLTTAAAEVIQKTDPDAGLNLEETLVHASYNPISESDRRLKQWLDSFLDKQASFRVKLRERRPQPTKIRCTSCQHELECLPELRRGLRPISGERRRLGHPGRRPDARMGRGVRGRRARVERRRLDSRGRAGSGARAAGHQRNVE